MNRAIPLSLLAVTIAGGLGYFALMGPGTRSTYGSGAEGGGVLVTQPDGGAGAVEPSPSGVDLAAVHPDRAAQDAHGDSGPALEWEIIPMNQVGQLIVTAKITATRGDGTRTGEGRVRWVQVPSGTWSVVIEAEGMPRYETEVTLQAAGRRRTVVRLGHEVRVEGTVVDTFGQPIARSTVYFLPTGIGHPENAVPLQRTFRSQKNGLSSKGKATGKPGKERAGTTGPALATVAVQTDAGGRFRAVLPRTGDWRVSVGPLGDARWTQRKAMELRNGGPNNVLVTVPALAQLGLRFGGPDSERPSRVTIYHFDAGLAARAGIERGDEEARAMKNAAVLAKERALGQLMDGAKAGGSEPDEGGTSALLGAARPSLDVAASGSDTHGGPVADEPPSHAPLFEPGWRTMRTDPISGTETILGDLPGGEDLRFLFVRGREHIATVAATRLRNGERSVGTVSLPRPTVESGSLLRSNRATISLRVLPKDESDMVESGVVLAYEL